MSGKIISPNACPAVAACPAPALGTADIFRNFGFGGSKETPKPGAPYSCFEALQQEKKLPQIVLGFTPSNDILTASISGMALLFSPWSSINALPQNSYEPAGLLHSPGCELLPAFPRGANAHGLGWLCPAWPQTSISDHSNKDNRPAEARC